MTETAAPTFIQPDPFQEYWKNPDKAFPLFLDEELGLMVIPDAQRIIEHHLMVVVREELSYDELPEARQVEVDALVKVVYNLLRVKIPSPRKPGILYMGNRVRTGHVHVYPRKQPTDGGLFYDASRPWATDEERKATQDFLRFSPELAAATHAHLLDVRARCKGLQAVRIS